MDESVARALAAQLDDDPAAGVAASRVVTVDGGLRVPLALALGEPSDQAFAQLCDAAREADLAPHEVELLQATLDARWPDDTTSARDLGYRRENWPYVRLLCCSRNADFVAAVSAMPRWRVRHLTLDHDEWFDGPGVEGWLDLVELERLADLTSLVLPDSHSDMVSLFLRGGRVHQLRSLTLRGAVKNDLGRMSTAVDRWGAKSLSAADGFRELRHLAMPGARLGDEGVAELVSAPFLRQLTSLDLSAVGATADGLCALFRAFPVDCGLESLTLCDSELGSDIVRGIAAAPIAATLTRLDLALNPLHDDWSSLTALSCPRLETLVIDGCDVDDAAVPHLAGLRHATPSLRELVVGLHFVADDLAGLRNALGRDVTISGESM